MFDVFVGGSQRGPLDVDGVLLEAVGQSLYARRKRGGHEVGASVFGKAFDDGFQFFTEAHVEHPVGFVENHVLHRGSIDGSGPDMVEHASGCTDHDGGASLENRALASVVGASGDDAGSDICDLFEEPVEFILHLNREFPGRGDDENFGLIPSARLALRLGFGGLVFGNQGLRQNQADSDSLAGAGLRGNPEVSTRRFGRDDGGLDRCQPTETPLFHGGTKRCGYVLEGVDVGHVAAYLRVY